MALFFYKEPLQCMRMFEKKKFPHNPIQTAVALILLLMIITYLYLLPKEVHIHAGFAVYKDNHKLDFSGEEYMHRTPCGEEGTGLPDHKIDLHDNVGDIVHVHRSDATWRDLFEELNLDLTDSVTHYINGQKNPNVGNQKIHDLDRVLILVGNNDSIDTKLQQVPSRERIQEVGSKSETCS